MKQLACPSNSSSIGQAFDVLEEVLGEHFDGEVRHRAGLGRRQVGRVAEDEDVVVLLREEVALVDGHVVQLVAESLSGR